MLKAGIDAVQKWLTPGALSAPDVTVSAYISRLFRRFALSIR